ncbi:hypothetical protein LJR296_003165 [Cupriavidus necator]|jgi:hypothetical protein|uniref:hypothetical protein n=1 Tax=Cupriavidus necator TaxID=106590 RepID=UPI003ECF9476
MLNFEQIFGTASMFPVHQGKAPDNLELWGFLTDLGLEVLAGNPIAFNTISYATPPSAG